MPRSHRTTARSIFALLLAGLVPGTADAAAPRQILFPVIGPAQYYDDFGASRGGHRHRGNDIVAARRAPVVAVETGRVERPSWSGRDCALILHGRSGTDYWYLHLNDDRTRRDDNRARNCGAAFAPGFRSGQRVRAGQLIGYVGNSGNAAGRMPHLHFELHPGRGRAVSPYRWLETAPRLLYAVARGVRSVRLSLHGTVRSVGRGFAIRVARVAVVGGWRGRPMVRYVTLDYAPHVVVEREMRVGALAAATLRSAERGERASVWTTRFAPTLATQLAGGVVLTAEHIRLRGATRP